MKQYFNTVKPGYDNFILPTKKYADIIIPHGNESINNVAIDLMVQHITTKLQQRENNSITQRQSYENSIQQANITNQYDNDNHIDLNKPNSLIRIISNEPTLLYSISFGLNTMIQTVYDHVMSNQHNTTFVVCDIKSSNNNAQQKVDFLHKVSKVTNLHIDQIPTITTTVYYNQNIHNNNIHKHNSTAVKLNSIRLPYNISQLQTVYLLSHDLSCIDSIIMCMFVLRDHFVDYRNITITFEKADKILLQQLANRYNQTRIIVHALDQ